MKKLILSIAATSVVSLSGHAQQLIFADNSSNSYDTTIGGVVNQSQDLNLELLVGSTAGTVTTDVVTLLLNGATANPTTALGSVQPAAGDITTGGGTIYDVTGSAYAVPAGTAFFEVEAWTGNYSSYAAAEASGQAGVFAGTSLVTAFTSTDIPTAGLPPADLNAISPFNLAQVPAVVPEPTTLAMTGVGLASMLIFRRKNK
jgi:hypothetical protein